MEEVKLYKKRMFLNLKNLRSIVLIAKQTQYA